MSANANTRVARRLVVVVFVMAMAGLAAVPAYNLFCKVTGFGGTTQEASQGSDVILDQTVTVRFDASLDRDMSWEFRPLQTKMEIRIGETGLAFFEAYNPTNRTIAGTAPGSSVHSTTSRSEPVRVNGAVAAGTRSRIAMTSHSEGSPSKGRAT